MSSTSGARVREASTQSSRTDQIRSIAAELFETHGYSATTMADIASAAGVLPGSLYHHFESKEVIAIELLAALEVDLTTLAARLERENSSLDAERRLRRLVAEVMILSYRHAAAVRLLTYEPPSVATEHLSRALRLRTSSLDGLWRDALDELAARTGAASSDVRLLRYALQNLSIDAAIDHPNHADPEKLADQLCELVLYGAVTDFDSDRLDDSDALAVAKRAVQSWGQPPGSPALQSTVRDKVLVAARLEFSRRGFDATTVRDIATTAGVTMGSLYRRAQSKTELLSEVIDPYSAHFDGAIRGILTTGTFEPASLDGLIWAFVHAARRFRAESDIVKVGWYERGSASSPLFDYFRSTEERLAILRALLGRGARAGTLRPIVTEPDVPAHFRFMMWLPYQDQNRTSGQNAHAFLRRILLRGFLTPDSVRSGEPRS